MSEEPTSERAEELRVDGLVLVIEEGDVISRAGGLVANKGSLSTEQRGGKGGTYSPSSSSESSRLVFFFEGFLTTGLERFLAGEAEVGGEERLRRGGEVDFVSSSSPASIRSSSSRGLRDIFGGGLVE